LAKKSRERAGKRAALSEISRFWHLFSGTSEKGLGNRKKKKGKRDQQKTSVKRTPMQ
jgi:hypothetical protein